jgi:hypothetical protein
MRAGTRLGISLLAALAIGCGGPVWMFSGGALSGPSKPHPESWSFSDSVEVVQLETRPDDPYSVNIWGAAVGSHFFIAAGDQASEWVAHLNDDPNVRVKVGDAIYELRAVRSTDAAERDAFLAAVKHKYDFQPEADQVEQAPLFRLEPRS